MEESNRRGTTEAGIKKKDGRRLMPWIETMLPGCPPHADVCSMSWGFIGEHKGAADLEDSYVNAQCGFPCKPSCHEVGADAVTTGRWAGKQQSLYFDSNVSKIFKT